MLFVNAFEDYLGYLKFIKRLSPHSITAYKEDLLEWHNFHHATFGLEDISATQLMHLRSYMIVLINEKKLQPKSIKRKISSLNSFFKYLQLQGLMDKNPAKQLQTPKVAQRLPQFLHENEADALTSVVENKTVIEDMYTKLLHQLILNLLYATGMRRSELINVTLKAINWSKKEIKVLGKGNKERIIPVPERILSQIDYLVKYKEKEFGIIGENILTLKSGKPVSISYVYRVVKQYLSEITTLKKKSPHTLRHTFASQLLNNGADLSAIQKLLGHQSLAATQIYTHVNIDKLKDVYRKAHPRSTED